MCDQHYRLRYNSDFLLLVPPYHVTGNLPLKAFGPVSSVNHSHEERLHTVYRFTQNNTCFCLCLGAILSYPALIRYFARHMLRPGVLCSVCISPLAKAFGIQSTTFPVVFRGNTPIKLISIQNEIRRIRPFPWSSSQYSRVVLVNDINSPQFLFFILLITTKSCAADVCLVRPWH